MRPLIQLNGDVLAANARAYARAGGLPVRAVVKSAGYGWGFETMVRAVEGDADGFCVADAHECNAVRRLTGKPIVVLATPPLELLPDLVDSGAIVNVETPNAVEVAARCGRSQGKALRLRVGVLAAVGWSGSTLEQIEELAAPLARCGALVEVWTHLTDSLACGEQLARLEEAAGVLRSAGVQVAGLEAASTYSLDFARPDHIAIRVGIGLFGAGAAEGVRCALHVEAPVIRTGPAAAGMRVGYGGTFLPMHQDVATARCGYGDGLPAGLAGRDDILSVGMQYVSAPRSRCSDDGTKLILLDESRNLDRFAADAGRSTHEVVTAFGNSARASRGS